MNDKNPTELRKKKRYSHIHIALSVKIGYQWKLVKALDWNEDGFNFFMNYEIPYSNLLFKKGHSKFAGQIKWIRKNDDAAFNCEMMLNTFIYDEISKFDDNNSMLYRLVKLIRTDGKIDEKIKILTALNSDVNERDIRKRIAEQEQDIKTYHYGVKVSARAWSDIVNYALEASSAIDAIDTVRKGLSQLADTMHEEDPPA